MYPSSMEPPNPNSRNIPDEKKWPYKEIHRSDSSSRVILGERKLPFPRDAIKTDENDANPNHGSDTTMFDAYYTNDGCYTDHTTIHRPSFGLAPQAPAPQPSYVPAPRRLKGFLKARDVGEDAAFFAHANRQYQKNIQDIVRLNKKKVNEDTSGTAEKKKEILTGKANVSNASKDINILDVFWGDH
ncbi:hypothetical protein DSL72_004426 [Monilinia vaccinii-corymbosi]|uniref:Uncharacterized protein n=1 Tax=Monilinia vaccinii-corymbosi TaxID=61207 RepID=A0A8A3P7E3_9HELO|nr:hypothetical protein DSL72_004426 [Monilinia vaccinii-corymbosi]